MALQVTKDTRKVKSEVSLLSAAFALACVFALNFPAVVYQTNADDIDSPFGYVSFILIPVCLVLTALLAFPGFFLKERARKIYASVVTALAIVIWLTGTFLISHKGLLTGAAALRTDSGRYQRLELAALIVGFLLLAVSAFRFAKLFKPILLLLILMNVGMFGFALLKDQKKYIYRGDESTFYRVSSKKNVFVFLFDGFLSDLYSEIIKKHPDIAKQFDGFTYFSKAASTAPTTYLSLPAIHSGMPYPEKRTLKRYYKAGIHQGSFITKLASAGYDAAGINFLQTAPINVTAFRSKEMGEGRWRAALKDGLFLLDISLYRSSPSILKQTIYNDGDWVFSKLFFDTSRAIENNLFLDRIGQDFHPSYQKPAVRWLHLFNTHAPASVDGNCIRVHNRPWTKDTAEDQAECAIRHFTGVLNQFKKKGIYNNAVIMLIADHGIAFSLDERPRTLASAHPIFLIKPIGHHGPLQISETPVSLLDVAKTVCSVTADCSVQTGISVFDNSADRNRAIPFNDYEWRNGFWGAKQIKFSSRYFIIGPVDDIFSWFKRLPARRFNKLNFDFTSKSDEDLLGFGWGSAQKDGRAVLGPYAQVYLPLHPGKDARLEIGVRTHPKNQHQEVTLFIDRERIATQPLPVSVQSLTFQIPGKSVTKHLSRVTFQFSQTLERDTHTHRDEPVTIAATISKLAVQY